MFAQPVPNFLTFDIEEWYRVNYPGIDPNAYSCSAGWMERQVDKLLALCAEASCKATFFVLGSVADSHPHIVRQIAAAGHEIASHSYSHRSVFSMTPSEFEEDLRHSCGVLESLTGKLVQGFRAPSFSVNRAVLPWFYEKLELVGLRYSSSVFPGRTFLYGIPDFPRAAHQPILDGHTVGITEFPMTCVNLAGRTLGLYVRLFPAAFLRRLIQAENRNQRSAMLYIHPREVDADQPRLPLQWPESFIHYFGIAGCERKLRRLLRNAPGRMLTLSEALELQSA